MNDRQLRNYKKYTLVLLLVTVGALIVCAAAFSFKRAAQAASVGPEPVVTDHYTPKQAASQETPAPGKASPSPSPQEEPAGYVVALRNGKICAYKQGQAGPVLISSAEPAHLPPGDLELLQAGIPAGSLAEARAILEDYE